MSSGLSLVNKQRKSCPSRLWSMSVGGPGNGRQPLDEPYTVQWMRWPISCGDQPPTGEPDAGEPPVRFGGRGRVSENFVCGSQREIKDGSDQEEGARRAGPGRQEAED